MNGKTSFSPDDLPVVNGRVYHLDLAPEELARDVILVGDPDRVPFLADELLGAREADRFHRGFRTITGIARETGLRVSIVTSGIGAPSAEIVLNELAALNEIDLATRRRKERFEPLTVVRVGTSGGLNPATALGALVLTDHVIALDNTGLFYDIPSPGPMSAHLEEEARRVLAGSAGGRFAGRISPYAARADQHLLSLLEREAATLGVTTVRGITVSSAGFFAEQGRGVARTGGTVHELLTALDRIDTVPTGLRLENMEMEAGFLLHFLAGLGYPAAALCAVINKRDAGVFAADFRVQMRDAARIAVRTFRALHGERAGAAF